jgi:hypothetical protein
MKTRLIALAMAVGLTVATSPVGKAQGTAFTFQGRLTMAPFTNAPPTGLFEMRAQLLDTNGVPVGPTMTNVVGVTNGLFTVMFDPDNDWSLFPGAPRLLALGVRTNGSTDDFTTLGPPQLLTPTPYAMYAARAGQATAVASNGVPGIAIQDGAITTNKLAPAQVVKSLNGLRDDVVLAAGDGLGLTAANGTLTLYTAPSCTDYTNCYWNLLGNGNTVDGTQFLGTFNGVPLSLRVNNQRVMRYEHPGASPNLIGGYGGNAVSGGAYGAVIGGGGSSADGINEVSANYGTIAGGAHNKIDTNAMAATISGGWSHTNQAGTATIGGGTSSAIWAGASSSTIAGGFRNLVQSNAYDATIGGGRDNAIRTGAIRSTIAGGHQNVIQPAANFATIPGGSQANANSYGQFAYAGGQFADSGDAQTSVYVVRRQTTDGSTNELFLDGATQRMKVPSNGTWCFDVLVTARSSAGLSAGYRLQGVIENSGGTTALVGWDAVMTKEEPAAVTWDAWPEADDANDALAIKVKGAASATIRWVAVVRTAEVIR